MKAGRADSNTCLVHSIRHLHALRILDVYRDISTAQLKRLREHCMHAIRSIDATLETRTSD